MQSRLKGENNGTSPTFSKIRLVICTVGGKERRNECLGTQRRTVSGGELLEMRLLDSHLLDTFGRKSTARHKIYQLLESS